MRKQLGILLTTAFVVTFFSFTTNDDKFENISKDVNAVKIKQNVAFIKKSLRDDFSKMSAEEYNKFVQGFKDQISLSTAEKQLFFKNRIKSFDAIKRSFTEIVSSIKELNNTNSEFKKLTQAEKNEFCDQIFETKIVPTCDMGAVYGLSGCASWAYQLTQQGYPQGYADDQFFACSMLVYVAWILCNENQA